MADTKITGLTATTSAVDADVLPIVTDIATMAVTKKITFANIKASAKATGAEGDTGTEDGKFLTPKAVNDSNNIPSVAPSTSGKVMTSNGTTWISSNPPYTLQAGGNSFNPADSTTYYFGLPVTPLPTTTAAMKRVYIPRAGTISRVDVAVHNNLGTQGTNETSTLSIRLNDTTDTTVTAALTANAASGSTVYFNVTGLSIAVATGDYIEFKLATPAWATNPTAVVIACTVYIN